MKSNVERQTEFRARQKEKGLKQKTIWIEVDRNETDPEIAENRKRIAELSAELARKQAEIEHLQSIIAGFSKKTFFEKIKMAFKRENDGIS